MAKVIYIYSIGCTAYCRLLRYFIYHPLSLQNNDFRPLVQLRIPRLPNWAQCEPGFNYLNHIDSRPPRPSLAPNASRRVTWTLTTTTTTTLPTSSHPNTSRGIWTTHHPPRPSLASKHEWMVVWTLLHPL